LGKKKRKNGSLANGEFGVRTICVDEMFVTLEMARCATPVRSGMAPLIGAAARAAGWGAVAAVVSAALRIRPVTTSPAKNAMVMKSAKTAIRRTIIEPQFCVPEHGWLSAG